MDPRRYSMDHILLRNIQEHDWEELEEYMSLDSNPKHHQEMENLPSDRRKAIEELEGGHEIATQLRRLVLNPRDLADKVVTSFSDILLLLNLPSHDSQMQEYSSSVVPAKSDDSEDRC